MGTLYSNPNKWEREQSFFETFKSAAKDFHIQNPRRENPPGPDYLFSVSQKQIGLEITSLVEESLAPISTAQNKCLRKAKALLEEKGMEPVNVKVQFRSDEDLIDVDEATDEATKELVDFVKEKIPEIDDTKSWHYYESGLKYSKWISIRLGTYSGHKWLEQHRVERIPINWLRTNLTSEIQCRIDEKQGKYSKYIQNCDECWLLIGVNEWTPPEAVEITEETKSHVFSGDFQRLFFLKNIEGRLEELKISSHTDHVTPT